MPQTLKQIAFARTKRLNQLPFLRKNKIVATNTFWVPNSNPDTIPLTGCEFHCRATGKKTSRLRHEDIFNTMDAKQFDAYISVQPNIINILTK